VEFRLSRQLNTLLSRVAARVLGETAAAVVAALAG
jgi:hypothetical protein